jgi:hypothetical protein
MHRVTQNLVCEEVLIILMPKKKEVPACALLEGASGTAFRHKNTPGNNLMRLKSSTSEYCQPYAIKK